MHIKIINVNEIDVFYSEMISHLIRFIHVSFHFSKRRLFDNYGNGTFFEWF